MLGPELDTVSEVLGSRTPCRRVGALAGPLVANNLAGGHPGGAIIGSAFPEVIEAVTDAIGGPRLRVYGTDDVVGVEVASALVGLVALALGYSMTASLGGLGIGMDLLRLLRFAQAHFSPLTSRRTNDSCHSSRSGMANASASGGPQLPAA